MQMILQSVINAIIQHLITSTREGQKVAKVGQQYQFD